MNLDFGHVVVLRDGRHSSETFFPADAAVAEIEISGLLPQRNYELEAFARNLAGADHPAEPHESRSAFSTIAAPGKPSGLNFYK